MCSKLYADGELAVTPYETDKVLRHQAVTDESIRDTLLDLANYSIMTVLEIDDAQHEQEIAEQKTCDEGASDAD